MPARLTVLGPPLAFVVAVHGLLQAVAALGWGVALRAEAWAVDLALHLLLALALLGLTRSRRAFGVLMVLVMAALHLGNAAKIAVLGAPIMPDDARAAGALLMILEDWQFAAALAFLGALAGALVLCLTPRAAGARWSLAGAGGLVAVVALAPGQTAAVLDSVAGNVVWNQRANYESRGPLLHLVQETARFAARTAPTPSPNEVLAAIDTLRPPLHAAALSVPVPPRRPSTAGPRNVHMIVLESFWDPSVLSAEAFPRDPLDPRFRALWEMTGQSRVLAPVFGGYTANSEFEALCGLPVDEDAVVFEAHLRNPTQPCLPRLFAEAGYATVASHPNIPAFWNRVNAYRRLGFDVYWSEDDFVLDDMNGDFLGDASLFRQVLGKLEPLAESGAPTFNYILTFFGHLDYPLNAARPRVIPVPGDDRLERYVNTVHHKSAEVMDLLARLRARDPDGLIVLFGDHLPFLGNNFEAYARSGVLGPDRGAFSAEELRAMVATPLIVIDGRNGPLELGTLPLYRLPGVIRRLAGLPGTAPMDLAEPPGGLALRPLPGLHLVIDEDGAATACRDGEDAAQPAACVDTAAWLDALRTVRADLLAGKQHVLRALGPAAPAEHAEPPPPEAAAVPGV